MSIDSTEMARKIQKKHYEQIGAKTMKKWKKIGEDKPGVVGKI